MKNIWKKAFFLLLGVNLLIVIFVFSLMIIPANDHGIPKVIEPNGKYVPFRIKTNKEDLNRLINYYLKKEAKDSPIDYQVRLDKEVWLYGSFPFLGSSVKLILAFEPEPLKNGDLILKQKSFAIGDLHLPIPYILKFISEHYKLPSGVVIQPNEQLVYIDMQKLKMKSNMKVKVNTFNLQTDDITFTLLVPVK